ncbi:hypothetical protein LCGC14_2786890, partial [marine sediment metagenome]
EGLWDDGATVQELDFNTFQNFTVSTGIDSTATSSRIGYWDKENGTITIPGTVALLTKSPSGTVRIYSHIIEDLSINYNTGAATAAAFECIDGSFGTALKANICSNTTCTTLDKVNDTTTDYSTIPPVRTLGVNDFAIGPPQSIEDYSMEATLNNIVDGCSVSLASNIVADDGFGVGFEIYDSTARAVCSLPAL